MSIPPNDNLNRPSDSTDWRAVPPHMSTSVGSEHFVSMASNPSPLIGNRPDSATSGELTTSPTQPTGLSATLEVDAQGRRYLRESSTGMRIDLYDGTGGLIPPPSAAAFEQPQNDTDGPNPSTTVSSESDVTPETRSDGATVVSAPSDGAPGTMTPDSMVASLLEALDASTLDPGQRAMLQTIQGALRTSRQRLLNTTAVVLDQRKSSFDTHVSLIQFRDETAARLTAFDDVIRSDHSDMELCIQENVRVLTELGESEASMSSILEQMGTSRIRANGNRLALPEYGPPDTQVLSDETSREVNNALPPRRENESTDQFQRRAGQSASSARRVAAAFPLQEVRRTEAPGPIKMTRFEDTGSISSAPRYRANAPEGISTVSTTGFGIPLSGAEPISGAGKSTFDAMEEFNNEAEIFLRSLLHRQVGEELDVPLRIRTPRLSSPSKFTGTNDHQAFVDWLQEVATWMRASFMGGPAADGYRITVLKTLLNGAALQWFVDYVETRNGDSVIPYEFDSIICAMHRRFITAATAQKATQEFDTVKYRPELGPLKLMDNLLDASNRMREPMPPFIIRQRFMRLLPESITGIMTIHRALSAEYSDVAALRFNANQLWDAYNLRNRTLNAASSVASAATTTPTPRINTNPRRDVPRNNSGPTQYPERRAQAGPSTAAATHGTNYVAPVVRANPSVGANAHKRCYKCDVIGHIGTDKECPKYAERPRFGAQRVDEGFVDEDHIDDPAEAGGQPQEELVNDHWGGSQYDPDADTHPSVADESPDLIDLSEAEGARVGAMHWRHFSMRIEPDDEEGASTSERPTVDPLFAQRGPLVCEAALSETQRLLSELTGRYTPDNERTVDGLYGVSASADVVNLQDVRARNLEEPYTPEQLHELQCALLREHEYPVSEYTTYNDAMFQYKLFEGTDRAGPLDEWAAIMTLGAAEHCRDEAWRVRSLRPGTHMTLSTRTLEYGMDRLVSDAAEYVPILQAIHEARSAIGVVIDTTRAALAEADIRTNPQSEGRTRDLRSLALESYQEILDDMLALDTGHMNTARRLESLQSVIVEEMRVRRDEERRLWRPDPSSANAQDESDNDGGPDDTGTGDDMSDSSIIGDGSPPPSYRSDSSRDANTSPPVEDDQDEEPALSSLEWHDLMAAAATEVNSAVNPATGISPRDTLMGPPQYSENAAASSETAPDDPSSENVTEISLLSRRIDPDLDLSADRDGSYSRHTWVFQSSTWPLAPVAAAGSSSHPIPQITEDDGADSPENPDTSNDKWWNIPGVHNEPADPEEPRDARRVWIHGSNADFENGYVSVLDTMTGPLYTAGSPIEDRTNDTDDPVETTEDPASDESSEYDAVPFPRESPEPQDGDELLIWAIAPTMGDLGAERCAAYVDHRGTVYTRNSPLPDTHYLSSAMRTAHPAAMTEAIRARAAELNS
ncbi:hypothetical protein DFH06DRAFT_1150829 [Mycena polygramma]|nr:hypothetical protein DFH06DRAFT_1150829 [Mycena polygramma]